MDSELLKRLETVVSRLEAIADSFSDSNGHSPLPEVISALSSISHDVGSGAKHDSSAKVSTSFSNTTASSRYIDPSSGFTNPSVKTFCDILDEDFSDFVECCTAIGGDLSELVALIKKVFLEQRDYLSRVSMCKEPPQYMADELLKGTGDLISEIQGYREGHRSSVLFNHLSMISESIPALGWVTVSPAPAPYVQEMRNAGEFYANRILKDYKGKDEEHCKLVKCWIEVLKRLELYIKEYHTTGVQWKKVGRDVMLPPCGGPPPVAPFPSFGGPPPPIPAASVSVDNNEVKNLIGSPSATPPPSAGARSNDSFVRVVAPRGFVKPAPKPKPPSVASQPSAKPSAVTSVGFSPSARSPISSPLMKTASNFTDKSNKDFTDGNSTPIKLNSPPEKKAINTTTMPQPKLYLDGKKWIVENYSGDHSVVLTDTDMKQTVYIYNCTDCVITVKGKVNMITLDKCRKTGVVFDEVISSVDFINCNGVQMQVLNKVPTVSVDKTDGCMIYLSAQSLDTQLITSKSSEMNLLIPDETSGEFTECPVPEQFLSVWNGRGFTTEPQTIS